MKRSFVLILALLIIIALPSCAEGKADVYSAYCMAMDTSCEVRVYSSEHASAADGCKELLWEIEKELSVTLKDSKTYTLNEKGSVSSGVHINKVASAATHIKGLTGGAYDPCIYPLVALWGFTTDSFRVPSEEEIAEAVGTVSSSVLGCTEESVSLSCGKADFGGIAKGYAADAVAEALLERGVESAFINLGGNVRTVGVKPDGSLWNIGINDPKGGIAGVLSVAECAVVTSGSYIRNFSENGRTYHHIIDPKTGFPADNGLVSVTVVCDSATLADGLSTAFFVMGLESASAIADSLGVETVFITDDSIYVSAGLKEKFTPDASAEGGYSIVYN
ncbi:MAG: FAD:protein FMN transferase [Clostridia bacterium]|nr:FAD:protein FMN transferase [Clostridia bacterium]